MSGSLTDTAQNIAGLHFGAGQTLASVTATGPATIAQAEAIYGLKSGIYVARTNYSITDAAATVAAESTASVLTTASSITATGVATVAQANAIETKKGTVTTTIANITDTAALVAGFTGDGNTTVGTITANTDATVVQATAIAALKTGSVASAVAYNISDAASNVTTGATALTAYANANDITITGSIGSYTTANAVLAAANTGNTSIASVTDTAANLASLTIGSNDHIGSLVATSAATAATANTLSGFLTAGKVGTAVYSIDTTALDIAGASTAALNDAVNINVSSGFTDYAAANTVMAATNSGTTTIASVTDTAANLASLSFGTNDHIGTLTANTNALVAQANTIAGFKTAGEVSTLSYAIVDNTAADFATATAAALSNASSITSSGAFTSAAVVQNILNANVSTTLSGSLTDTAQNIAGLHFGPGSQHIFTVNATTLATIAQATDIFSLKTNPGIPHATDVNYGINDYYDLVLGAAADNTEVILEATSVTAFGDNNTNNSIDFSTVGRAVTVLGYSGDDVIIGTSYSDSLNGGAGNDTITGGSGADTMIGGDGDDTFVYNATTDLQSGEVVSGGTGSNAILINAAGTYNFAAYATVTQIGTLKIHDGSVASSFILGDHTNTGGTLEVTNTSGQAITNAVNINASAFTDTQLNVSSTDLNGGNSITGGALADIIHGGNGNNILTGGGGADLLYGGSGNDIFVYNAPTDLVAGEVISGGSGNNSILLNATGAYNFSAATVSNIQTVNVNVNGPSALSITLSDATNTNGVVEIANTTGNTITHAVNIDASSFTTTVLNVSATDFNGNDSIVGGALNDTINGGGGDDTIVGGTGANSIIGGAGADTISVDSTGGNHFIQNQNDSLLATSSAASNFTVGQVLTFASGVDAITGFDAGRTGDVIILGDGSNVALSILGESTTAITQSGYLSGDYDATAHTFTVATNGAGSSTLLLQAGGTGNSLLTTNSSMVILVGVDSDNLYNENLGGASLTANWDTRADSYTIAGGTGANPLVMNQTGQLSDSHTIYEANTVVSSSSYDPTTVTLIDLRGVTTANATSIDVSNTTSQLNSVLGSDGNDTLNIGALDYSHTIDLEGGSNTLVVSGANQDIHTASISSTGGTVGLSIVAVNTYAAYFGSPTQWGNTIEQAFTDTNGATYTISFDVTSYDNPSGLKVLVDGMALTTIEPVPSYYPTLHTYTVTFTGTGADTLEFDGYNRPNSVYVTNISVVTAGGSNLILNGDFSTGDFTGWTTNESDWQGVTLLSQGQSGLTISNAQYSNFLVGGIAYGANAGFGNTHITLSDAYDSSVRVLDGHVGNWTLADGTNTFKLGNAAQSVTGGTGADSLSLESYNATGSINLGADTVGTNTILVKGVTGDTQDISAVTLGGTASLDIDASGTSTIKISSAEYTIFNAATILTTNQSTYSNTTIQFSDAVTNATLNSGVQNWILSSNGPNIVSMSASKSDQNVQGTGTANDTVKLTDNGAAYTSTIALGDGYDTVTALNVGSYDLTGATLSGVDLLNTAAAGSFTFALNSDNIAGIGAIQFNGDGAATNTLQLVDGTYDFTSTTLSFGALALSNVLDLDSDTGDKILTGLTGADVAHLNVITGESTAGATTSLAFTDDANLAGVSVTNVDAVSIAMNHTLTLDGVAFTDSNYLSVTGGGTNDTLVLSGNTNADLSHATITGFATIDATALVGDLLTINANTLSQAAAITLSGNANTELDLFSNTPGAVTYDLQNWTLSGFGQIDLGSTGAVNLTVGQSFVNSSAYFNAGNDDSLTMNSISSYTDHGSQIDTPNYALINAAAGATINVSASTISGTYGWEIVDTSGDVHYTGSSGNDLFVFKTGELTSSDTVDGGTGTDILRVTGATGVVDTSTVDIDFTNVSNLEQIDLTGSGTNTLVLGTNADAAFAGGVTITSSGTLNLDASASGGYTHNITVTGTANNDTIIGGSGNDTINALGGEDTIDAGAGADTINLTPDGAQDNITQGAIQSEAVTVATFFAPINQIVADDLLVFNNGLDIVTNFAAGHAGTGYAGDVLHVDFTTAQSIYGQDPSALTSSGYLSGLYDPGSKTFTISGDGQVAGPDTLVVQITGAGGADLTTNKSYLLLQGVVSSDLYNSNFNGTDLEANWNSGVYTVTGPTGSANPLVLAAGDGTLSPTAHPFYSPITGSYVQSQLTTIDMSGVTGNGSTINVNGDADHSALLTSIIGSGQNDTIIEASQSMGATNTSVDGGGGTNTLEFSSAINGLTLKNSGSGSVISNIQTVALDQGSTGSGLVIADGVTGLSHVTAAAAAVVTLGSGSGSADFTSTAAGANDYITLRGASQSVSTFSGNDTVRLDSAISYIGTLALGDGANTVEAADDAVLASATITAGTTGSWVLALDAGASVTVSSADLIGGTGGNVTVGASDITGSGTIFVDTGAQALTGGYTLDTNIQTWNIGITGNADNVVGLATSGSFATQSVYFGGGDDTLYLRAATDYTGTINMGTGTADTIIARYGVGISTPYDLTGATLSGVDVLTTYTTGSFAFALNSDNIAHIGAIQFNNDPTATNTLQLVDGTYDFTSTTLSFGALALSNVLDLDSDTGDKILTGLTGADVAHLNVITGESTAGATTSLAFTDDANLAGVSVTNVDAVSIAMNHTLTLDGVAFTDSNYLSVTGGGTNDTLVLSGNTNADLSHATITGFATIDAIALTSGGTIYVGNQASIVGDVTLTGDASTRIQFTTDYDATHWTLTNGDFSQIDLASSSVHFVADQSFLSSSIGLVVGALSTLTLNDVTNYVATTGTYNGGVATINAADGSAQIDLHLAIQDLAAPTTHGWVINGGNGNDQLIGSRDNDTILGGAGADTINGGAGADTIELGVGSPLAPDAAIDTVVEGVNQSITTSQVGLTSVIATGDFLKFGNGVDVVTNFLANFNDVGAQDVLKLDNLPSFSAGHVVANLWGTTNGTTLNLVAGTVYFASGDWDGSKFTFNADNENTGSTIVIQGNNDSLTGNDSAVVLVGVHMADLHSANFA